MKKYFSVMMCSTLLILTACGNNNKSMYTVDKSATTNTESTPKPSRGYGIMQAQVAEDADSDKDLPKKTIIMVNGQPIASLVGEYENEYGFSSNTEDTDINDGDAKLNINIGGSISASLNSNTTSNEDEELDITVEYSEEGLEELASALESLLVASELSKTEEKFVNICEDKGLKTFALNFKALAGLFGGNGEVQGDFDPTIYGVMIYAGDEVITQTENGEEPIYNILYTEADTKENLSKIIDQLEDPSELEDNQEYILEVNEDNLWIIYATYEKNNKEQLNIINKIIKEMKEQ